MGKILTVLLIIVTWSCSNEKSTEKPEPRSSFQKMQQAHGGVDTWNQYNSLEFDRISDDDTVHHMINLKTREELMSNSQYTVFFGKDHLWISPDKQAFGKEDPRFYKNLWFYFFSLPFVSGDEGVNQIDTTGRQLGNSYYHGVKLTFGDDTGDSPDDQYLLWLDSNNYQLQWINYSVTFWNKENADRYSALVYENWSESGGLLVPGLLTGYRWENDSLGKERYQYTFENIKFSTNFPDSTRFVMPEAAYAEQF